MLASIPAPGHIYATGYRPGISRIPGPTTSPHLASREPAGIAIGLVIGGIGAVSTNVRLESQQLHMSTRLLCHPLLGL